MKPGASGICVQMANLGIVSERNRADGFSRPQGCAAFAAKRDIPVHYHYSIETCGRSSRHGRHGERPAETPLRGYDEIGGALMLSNQTLSRSATISAIGLAVREVE
jgi:hypothetical protein